MVPPLQCGTWVDVRVRRVLVRPRGRHRFTEGTLPSPWGFTQPLRVFEHAEGTRGTMGGSRSGAWFRAGRPIPTRAGPGPVRRGPTIRSPRGRNRRDRRTEHAAYGGP